MGIYKDYAIPLCIANTFLFLGIQLIRGKKVEIPRNYLIYIVFFVTLLVHSYFFKGSIYYITLFFSGGLCWLLVFNLRHLVSKLFPPFLISLGIFMALLNIVYRLRGVTYLTPDNLFLPLSTLVIHNHLGDVWALIIVVLIYKMCVKIHTWHFTLTLIGLFTIVLSHSRSAIVSLAVGGIYILYNLMDKKKLKRILVSALAILAFLFLYVSINKSTLFSRPYFELAISSLINSPMGLGVGNFYKVSSQSSVVHNIVLEFLSGMGVFSGIFIFWLIRIFRDFNQKNTSILYKALFLSIFTNLSFDTTYTIPTMIWVWFSTIALIFI